MSDQFYAWVRVGDGDPEPAVITGKRGERKAVTLGCPDAFQIDEKGCPCRFVYDAYVGGDNLMAVLEPPDEEVSATEAKKREREWRRYQRRERHSYAGYGASNAHSR